MEILLAVILGAVIGVATHYLIGLRETRGVLLAPALGAIGGAAAWTAMTWAGFGPDSLLIWAATIGAGILLAVAPTAILTRIRGARDDRAREGLHLS